MSSILALWVSWCLISTSEVMLGCAWSVISFVFLGNGCTSSFHGCGIHRDSFLFGDRSGFCILDSWLILYLPLLSFSYALCHSSSKILNCCRFHICSMVLSWSLRRRRLVWLLSLSVKAHAVTWVLLLPQFIFPDLLVVVLRWLRLRRQGLLQNLLLE